MVSRSRPATPRAAKAAGKATPAKTTPAKPARRTVAASPVGPDDLFRDGKEAGALRTIGEVAQALGLRQHVLRYWEGHFPMLRPLTRAGGRRYYRPADIALLIRIDRLLHREGYTIRGAAQALARPPARRAPPAPARDSGAPLLDAIVADAVPEVALVSALSVLRQHLEASRQRLASALRQA